MTEINDVIKAMPNPEALSPAAIQAKSMDLAQAKATMPLGKLAPLAILAGMYIALGALFFTLFMADSALPFAAAKFAGGIVFSLGLSLVMVAGAELFTGNSLMVAGVMSGRLGWGTLLKNWVLVWLFNLVGSLLIVFLVYMAHVQDMGPMASGMLKVAIGKLTPDWGTLFFKGILCNLLVCLGVWMGFAGRSVTDKVFGVMLPVSAFVALGFEHCIANMFFLPIAFMLKCSGYAPNGIDTSVITINAILHNLSAATLGNIVGGGLLGVLYWFAFARKKVN